MKKFIFFIVISIILISSKHNSQQFSLNNYFNGTYYCYTNTATNNSVDLGFCNLSTKQEKPNIIIGESIKVENLEIGTAIKELKAKVIKTEYLNNQTIIYAFSPLIKTNIILNNKKVNLQISIKNNISTIGWPLILGSF